LDLHRSDNEAYEAKKRIRGSITADDLRKIHDVKKTLRKSSTNTVCENAKCPNLPECFSRSTATFIILGNDCTRNCAFCAVTSKSPRPVDKREPKNVARAVKRLGLKHVVITSVTRDDIADRGVAHFIRTIDAVKCVSPETSIEILTPDFHNVREEELKELIEAQLAVWGHNMEMPQRLYPTLRKSSDYYRSLDLLRRVKSISTNGLKVKSAIMLGLGEAMDEVKELLSDIRSTGCDTIVIGQYLQPTLKHAPVIKYYSPDDFKELEVYSYSLGFEKVHAFPKARSSYAI